tara:strand:+ start:1316 stop:1963 length:648 start_codon:yes stop_codon:yes gene_type:complete
MDIVRVSEKLAAFRADYPATEYGLLQSFTEDHVGDIGRVIGCCEVVDVATRRVLARAYGTRALRPPIPGAQGAKDTRDPDRAMTQALGRVLGLMGYADRESIEGNTDEPDQTGVTIAAPPAPPRSPAAVAKLHLAGNPPPEPAVTPPDPVSTDAIKKTLNGLDAMTKGKLKYELEKRGYTLPLPDQLTRDKYDELDALLPELIKELVGDAAPTKN